MTLTESCGCSCDISPPLSWWRKKKVPAKNNWAAAKKKAHLSKMNSSPCIPKHLDVKRIDGPDVKENTAEAGADVGRQPDPDNPISFEDGKGAGLAVDGPLCALSRAPKRTAPC
jgi:hypothetical protein